MNLQFRTYGNRLGSIYDIDKKESGVYNNNHLHDFGTKFMITPVREFHPEVGVTYECLVEMRVAGQMRISTKTWSTMSCVDARTSYDPDMIVHKRKQRKVTNKPHKTAMQIAMEKAGML
jgi:hypothetical protein